MESAETAIARAQALLDPTGQGLFQPQRLMPYLNLAYAALRNEAMALREITADTAVVALPALPALTKDLGAYVATGGLLQSLAAPITLREKPAGSDDTNYSEMLRVMELPSRDPEDRNRVYEWRGGNLYFIGATQALDLEVRFEQLWPALANPQQALGAAGLAAILGYWTAGLMATAMREENLGGQYVAEARHQLYAWMQRQVLDAQAITRRPRPYSQGAVFLGDGIW